MSTISIGPAQPEEEKAPGANARTRLRAVLGASGRMQRVRVIAHRTVMVAGVSAIGAIGLMFIRPELTDHIKAMSPFASPSVQQASATPLAGPDMAATPFVMPVAVPAIASSRTPIAPASAPGAVDMKLALEDMQLAPAGRQFAQAKAPTAAPAVVPPTQSAAAAAIADPHQAVEHAVKAGSGDSKEHREAVSKEQKWVTNWLAKRYRVAGDAAHMLVSATYRTATEVKIDPLLVLAVMAIESGFNPFAESPVGAQGLMQVMSKVHHDKFQPLGGVKAALNPVANIKVGATILKEYVSRGGSVESGLKMYVGAAAFETDSGYGYKVLAEYKRLKDVASGKAVPVTSTSTATVAAKTPPKPAPQADADDKVDVLTQADTPALKEKNQDENGVIAAL